VLDSANHILLAYEPAWEQFLAELHEFLGTFAPPPGSAAVEDLSPRELEVLELVAAGLTNDEIAKRLVLSARTVKRHLTNIYAKLRPSGKAARAGAAVRFTAARRSPGRHAG
jgi:DNA-binding NarL/FixJ family response regulator